MAKVLTAEELAEKEAKKAERKRKRAERLESFKEGLAVVGGATAPIFVPILLIMGLSMGSTAKNKKEKNEYDDLLAQGLGYAGRKDPKYIADMWKKEHERNDTIATTYEEVEDDE